MKNKIVKYKWNYRKFLKNLWHLILFIAIIATFALNILYILGVDIIK